MIMIMSDAGDYDDDDDDVDGADDNLKAQHG